jgi:hypothetical protein
MAALETLERLAASEEFYLDMNIGEGDIQFLNQHVTYHGRTAYADDVAAGAHRVLLRIWLAMPNSRPLPAGLAAQWGATEAGALRGGAIRAKSAFA